MRAAALQNLIIEALFFLFSAEFVLLGVNSVELDSFDEGMLRCEHVNQKVLKDLLFVSSTSARLLNFLPFFEHCALIICFEELQNLFLRCPLRWCFLVIIPNLAFWIGIRERLRQQSKRVERRAVLRQ